MKKLPALLFGFMFLAVSCGETTTTAESDSKSDGLPDEIRELPTETSTNNEDLVPDSTVSDSTSIINEDESSIDPVESETESDISTLVGDINEATNTIKEESAKPIRLHLGFDALLKKHVSANGTVNYKTLKKDKSKLDAYCTLLSTHPVQKAWTKDKKLAYWINAYNAFTLKLIVDNYPLKSITDLHGGKPWDQKWINIGTKKYSLNQIENDIIRPQFKDPRIHFAVNCAAKSCPKLMNGAFLENYLDTQLDNQTKAFINNSVANTLQSNKVQVSKIFEWYAVDFGDLNAFLNKYSNTKINKGAPITYKEYNWQLNE